MAKWKLYFTRSHWFRTHSLRTLLCLQHLRQQHRRWRRPHTATQFGNGVLKRERFVVFNFRRFSNGHLFAPGVDIIITTITIFHGLILFVGALRFSRERNFLTLPSVPRSWADYTCIFGVMNRLSYCFLPVIIMHTRPLTKSFVYRLSTKICAARVICSTEKIV